MKWWRRTGVVLVGLALWAGWFFAVPLLHVNTGRTSAPVVVVLGGDAAARPFRALELVKAVPGRRILISGDGDNDLIKRRLIMAGVPPESIAQEANSRSTKENAEYSVRWLREQGVSSAVVVTSWFHSRRAMACFRHFAGTGLAVTSAPAYEDEGVGARPSIYELPAVYIEYLKIGWYGMRHGVWPWEAN